MGIEDILNQASASGEVDEVKSPESEGVAESEVNPELQEVQESEEAPVTEVEKAAEEKPKAEETPAADVVDPKEVEIRELRQMLRESKIQMAAMREKVTGLGKKISDDGEETEVSGNIEKLQQQIATVAAAKAPVLDVLVETMEMSPKYQDISSVCSRAHFDDIFEMVARSEAQRTGKPFEEALLEAELSVWKMANPYKYMYNIIKTYHPDFAKRAPAVQDSRKPVVAPSSVSSVGGGGSGGSGGWTASRIDAMDVNELDSVPADIYQKYLLGQLK